MPYLWIKALHVISVIAWMAGMLYLPRLFVYHADAKPGSELSETLKIMERRLLRRIINPAMIATFVFGIWMIALTPILSSSILSCETRACAGDDRHPCFSCPLPPNFAADRNEHSALFYRFLIRFRRF